MKKIVFIALAVMLIGLLGACSQDDETTEKKGNTPAPVETAKAEQGDLVIEKTIYGRTAPASSTPIMLPAPGKISSLEVENGDKVDEDDLIATLSGGQSIYAPKAGEIANLNAEAGSIVSDTDPLAVIADFDTLKIQFTVTADELDLFKKEAKHDAVIDGEKVEAEITSIGKLPDDTGLYPVEATFDNQDGDFVSGVVAKLSVPEKKVKDTIIVPTAAVVNGNGESFVFVVKDDQAVKTNVTIKETQSEQTAIKGEVDKDALIVTSGQTTLTDGSKVNVVKEGNES